MSILDGIFQQVKNAIGRKVSSAAGDAFNNPAAQDQSYQNRDIRPASEDRYGDPADSGHRNVRPASEDPYGDPADQ